MSGVIDPPFGNPGGNDSALQPPDPNTKRGCEMLLDIAARRSDFHALHGEGYFLLPTAWDAGGAKRLEALGYAGIATTMPSLAWTLGRDVDSLTRDDVLAHMREIANATETAVNADFGFGFATSPVDLIDNVHMAIDTGIAAISIGDRVGGALCSVEQAASQIQKCSRAIESSGADVMLVARSECLLANPTDVSAAIKRLAAFCAAGAHVLALPGLADADAIKAVVLSVSPKPLDIQLMRPGLTATELGQLGVRRISVGDSFAEAAWASFERVAEEFIDYGDLAKECRPGASSDAPN